MVDYNTLNKDINLVEKDCGYWDYEMELGDLKIVENKESLRNGLIIACLTSWNYLNRKGNPTYSIFGNRAYEELKKKKSSMVQYKIQQYFIEVLNRIRRVYKVESVEVVDHPTDLNAYIVKFSVQSINDEIIRGQFPLTTESKLSTSYITVTNNYYTCNPLNPVTFTVTLMSEYGVPLEGELVYVLHNNDTIGIIGPTDDKGEVIWRQYPFDHMGYDEISFRFNGNSLFNYSENNENRVLSIPYLFDLDEDNDELYIIKNPTYNVKCWLGEIISTTNELVIDEDRPYKCYLIPNGEDYTKYVYRDNEWKTIDGIYSIINKPTDLKYGDIRLFVEDTDYRLYMVEDHIIAEL